MKMDAFGSIREGVNINIQRSDGKYPKPSQTLYATFQLIESFLFCVSIRPYSSGCGDTVTSRFK